MQPVATEFEDRTFRYRQLERHGMIAIYEQRHKTSDVTRYEVVRIRERAEHTWPNGTTTPAHEAYPGHSAWGTDGFSCFTLAEAQALARRLRHDAEEPADG